MREEAVATVIDRLVDLVQARGATNVKDAAKELAISEAQVEEIANVLADSGMIGVRYTLTGVILEPRKVAAAKPAGLAETAKGAGLSKRMKVLEKELADTERSFRTVSEEIVRRIQQQEAELKAMEGDEEAAGDEELAFMLKEASQLQKAVGRFVFELKGFKEKLDELSERIFEFETRTVKMRGQSPGERKEMRRGLVDRVLSKLGRGKRG